MYCPNYIMIEIGHTCDLLKKYEKYSIVDSTKFGEST